MAKRAKKLAAEKSPLGSRRIIIPRVERKPIFGRGPRGLAGLIQKPEIVSGPGPIPTSGPLALATKPEWAIYWALTRLGKKPGIDFNYRGEVTLRSSLATAAQLDFTILDGSQIAIEVEGIYWHYAQGTTKVVGDVFRATELAQAGWNVIFIDEDDALRNPIYYVSEALVGRDHSYAVKPTFFMMP